MTPMHVSFYSSKSAVVEKFLSQVESDMFDAVSESDGIWSTNAILIPYYTDELASVCAQLCKEYPDTRIELEMCCLEEYFSLEYQNQGGKLMEKETVMEHFDYHGCGNGVWETTIRTTDPAVVQSVQNFPRWDTEGCSWLPDYPSEIDFRQCDTYDELSFDTNRGTELVEMLIEVSTQNPGKFTSVTLEGTECEPYLTAYCEIRNGQAQSAVDPVYWREYSSRFHDEGYKNSFTASDSPPAAPPISPEELAELLGLLSQDKQSEGT